MVFFVLGGIWNASWKGDWQWCVYFNTGYLISADQFRDEACHFFCNYNHVGTPFYRFPMGTGSIIPFCTSSVSRLSLISCFQWYGMGIGVCVAFGVVSGLRWMCAGVVSMAGKEPLALKALVENWSKIYCLVWEHSHWLQGRVGVQVFQVVAKCGLVLQWCVP